MGILKEKKIIFITPKENIHVKGGIASWTKKLQKQGLPNNYAFRIVDSSVMFNRGIFNFTKYNFFYEILRTLRITTNLFYFIVSFRAKILHINSSISKFGIYRDLICLLIGKSLGLKTYIHFRGNLPQEWQKNSRLSKLILNILIRLSHGSIAINLPSFLFLQNRASRNRIFKLESFIEERDFNKAKKHLDSLEEPNVIFIGAFIKEKGAEEVLALSRALPDINFHLVGQISEKYEEKINRLDNLYKRGIFDRKEVLNALQESDILLFPSHSEGFPNVVLEAMSQGIPVVASNVGAIPEMIIHGKGGYLSNIGDVESFEENIRALSRSSKREEMGRYNFQRAKDLYTYDIVIQKMLKIYQA